jgi:hypothetical protein
MSKENSNWIMFLLWTIITAFLFGTHRQDFCIYPAFFAMRYGIVVAIQEARL